MFEELYHTRKQFLHYEATRLTSSEKQGPGALEHFKVRLWINVGAKTTHQISLLFSGNVIDVGILFAGALMPATRINLYAKPYTGSVSLSISETLQLEGFGFYDGTIFLKLKAMLN